MCHRRLDIADGLRRIWNPMRQEDAVGFHFVIDADYEFRVCRRYRFASLANCDVTWANVRKRQVAAIHSERQGNLRRVSGLSNHVLSPFAFRACPSVC